MLKKIFYMGIFFTAMTSISAVDDWAEGIVNTYAHAAMPEEKAEALTILSSIQPEDRPFVQTMSEKYCSLNIDNSVVIHHEMFGNIFCEDNPYFSRVSTLKGVSKVTLEGNKDRFQRISNLMENHQQGVRLKSPELARLIDMEANSMQWALTFTELVFLKMDPAIIDWGEILSVASTCLNFQQRDILLQRLEDNLEENVLVNRHSIYGIMREIREQNPA